ncbi:MAG: class I SAM-dependent methyltransferase [Candidatus Cloacimonetes bacterium]|nr:class I SAM-dependent methyltransferase [Candidatus Cloacimonadota bacterium]MBL7085745.1 class I SAM-dependent methyltransferase [Candidatus Cloacimonadota bacterium]
MIRSYYENYWRTNKLEKTPYLFWIKKISSTVTLNGKNFLDVGCGDGFLASNFVNKFETYGVDISKMALNKAKNKGIRTEFVDLNTNNLPFENEFFDNISCFEVLEHLLEPLKVTKEINRVLKKGGCFIVSVPNILNIINRIHFLFGNFVDVMDVAHKNNELFSEHIKMFSKDKLEKLLEGANFEITKRYFYFPKKFNEPKWKKIQFLGNIFNVLKIHTIMPSLLALGFLYVCKKKK